MRGELQIGASGRDIFTAIERAAEAAGQSVIKFAAPLSRHPRIWLRQVRDVQAVKPATVDRVNALIAGRPVPVAPQNNFQLRGLSRPSRVGSIMPAEPKVRVGDRVDRDPCARCGVRGDLGCQHRAAGERW